MKQRLTAKEEEVMNILWKNGDMFIRDIVAAMPEPRPNYNTVATQVKFLEEKGFVVRRPMANSFLYSVASGSTAAAPSGTWCPGTTATPTAA